MFYVRGQSICDRRPPEIGEKCKMEIVIQRTKSFKHVKARLLLGSWTVEVVVAADLLSVGCHFTVAGLACLIVDTLFPWQTVTCIQAMATSLQVEHAALVTARFGLKK